VRAGPAGTVQPVQQAVGTDGVARVGHRGTRPRRTTDPAPADLAAPTGPDGAR